MNTLTITSAALHAALAEVEAIGRIQGTAAYAGGIAALRAMFGPDVATSPIAAVPSEVHRALASTPRAARDNATIGEAKLSARADSLPSIDPPITFPPLPTGPGAAPPGARDTPAACSAIPAPSPPPVLAAEGTPAAPEASHAPPGKVREPALLHPAREAAFRAAWPDPAVTNSVIRARLNATPGREIKNDPALYRIAASLGLPKRGEMWQARQAQAEDAAAADWAALPAAEQQDEPVRGPPSAEQELAREAPGAASLCAEEAPPAPAPEVIEPAAPTFAAPENPAETSGTPAPTPALRPAWRRPEPPLPGPTEKVASIKFDPKSLDPLDNGLDEPRNVTTARGLLGDGYGVEYVARMTRLPASSVRAIVAEMEKAGTA